jgi:hypothetical protein
VAVFFHKSPRKLLDACDRPHVSANDALIAAARQRAEGVVTAAQRAWFATGRRVVEAELEALG